MRRSLLASLAVLGGLAGCELPPLALRFSITDNASQQCTGDTGNVTSSCEDITMLCDAVLSVRIVPPNDPTVPYVSVCRPLIGAQHTLCSIAGIDLPAPTVPIPEQVLEVQMAVFPRSAVTQMDPVTGDLVCPRVEFAANGLPITALPVCSEQDPTSCPRMPAVGGRAFYSPGDEETVVELGCSDLTQLQDELTCEGIRRIQVTATVNDFDDLVSSVGDQLADSLTVDIGEPKPASSAYTLVPGNTRELIRSEAVSPAWSLQLTDLTFQDYVCLQVLEDGAQATSALSCRADDDSDKIDMAGIYLSKITLNQILKALALPSFPLFPDEGLVVGIVIDEFFNPLPNVAVSCGGCDMKYLNANRSGLVTGTTSMSGIFVSTNAPFGTGFTIPSTALRPVLGGLVERKVTIVVIQDKLPIGP
jgi:hypothetical protein